MNFSITNVGYLTVIEVLGWEIIRVRWKWRAAKAKPE